jgi:hypothetical protein
MWKGIHTLPFMVERVELIFTKEARFANIDAEWDNNIVVSEEEIQDIRKEAIRKKKLQELWDVKSHWKFVEEA